MYPRTSCETTIFWRILTTYFFKTRKSEIIYTDTLEYFNQKVRNMAQENKFPETCELFFVKCRSQTAQLSMNLNFLAES